MAASSFRIFAALCGLASVAILEACAPSHIQATYDFGFIRCVYGFSLGALAYSLWLRTHGWISRWAGKLEWGALPLVVIFVSTGTDRMAILAA